MKRMGGRSKKRARIVICGCGYGGIASARRLASLGGGDFEVIAINDKPFLYQYPMLPRLLLNPALNEKICRLLPPLLNKFGARFIQGRVGGIVAEEQSITVNDDQIAYDYLVLATGARAIPLAQDSGFQVYYPKAEKQLAALRAKIDALDPKSTLRIAIVGGGLTGIEFAAAMRAYANRFDRPNGGKRIVIELMEMGSRIAADCLPAVSEALHNQLTNAGIRVHTHSEVRKAICEGVLLKSGAIRRADVVVSAIGCEPNLRFEHPNLHVATKGIETDEHLRCQQHRNIYAIGDVARPPQQFTVRKRASYAISMGQLAAQNICNDHRGHPLQSLQSLQRKREKVSVLTGQRNALIAYGNHHISGISGYAIKLFLENHYT